MATTAKDMQDRSAGVSYQELIAQDAVPPPQTLTLEGKLDSPITSVPVSRYTTAAFHDVEMEKLWPKVWQMACREEEIPNVGGDWPVLDFGRAHPRGCKGASQCLPAPRSQVV